MARIAVGRGRRLINARRGVVVLLRCGRALALSIARTEAGIALDDLPASQ
jgi:hypothetical protein